MKKLFVVLSVMAMMFSLSSVALAGGGSSQVSYTYYDTQADYANGVGTAVTCNPTSPSGDYITCFIDDEDRAWGIVVDTDRAWGIVVDDRAWGIVVDTDGKSFGIVVDTD
jgi:hypothetical protein